jgi:hypothetical protein
MNYRHFLFLMPFVFSINAYATENIIGQTILPYPTGWSEQSGSCIRQMRSCEYCVSTLSTPINSYVYLGKAANRIDANKSRWTIIYSIDHPTVPKGFEILLSGCEDMKDSGKVIFAVAKSAETEFLTEIREAFQIHIPDGLISRISPENIQCANPGWGL